MFTLLSRNLTFVLVMGAAIAGPYLLTDGNWRKLLPTLPPSPVGAETDPYSATSRVSTPRVQPTRNSGGSPSVASRGESADETGPLGPNPFRGLESLGQSHPVLRVQPLPLEQALRFDATPDWILARFPRVTTFQDGAWEGLRVVLVTGTRPEDLAGSLTYFFDRSEQVQRITLAARTGDPQVVERFAKEYYKLREAPGQPGVLLSTWNREPISALLIRRASLVTAEQPLGIFDVQLELNRPANRMAMSPAMRRQVAN